MSVGDKSSALEFSDGIMGEGLRVPSQGLRVSLLGLLLLLGPQEAPCFALSLSFPHLQSKRIGLRSLFSFSILGYVAPQKGCLGDTESGDRVNRWGQEIAFYLFRADWSPITLCEASLQDMDATFFAAHPLVLYTFLLWVFPKSWSCSVLMLLLMPIYSNKNSYCGSPPILE